MTPAESPEHDSSTSSTTLGRAWLWACLLIAGLAALTRFLYLAEKPFHHDESLHGYYSNRVAQGYPHEYSALLHGPVLYYLVGAFMKVFGSSDFNARFPAALCGLLIVLLPLLWRKKIGNAAALATSVLLLLSPTFMYFARFLREDAFNSLWIACSLAGFFGYRWTRKPWMAVCASAFLAMQFCNKENSYLHVFIWLTGGIFIVYLSHLKSQSRSDWRTNLDLPSRAVSERIALWVNCVLIFAVIYVLFYSSFFRHSKGSLHGIIDGLYRESLLYWWDQNQKRRIDGPFDYHSPLFFNYEFALIPALVAGWFRCLRLASFAAADSLVRPPFTMLKHFKAMLAIGIVVLSAVFFLPRVGFTGDGCSISEFCLSKIAPADFSGSVEKFARLVHIAHSRHLLQIVAAIVLGAIAFLSTVTLNRRLDAFLWWWATGAVGVYSYVGEKVPWLLVYILLPLFALAGLELGRSLQRAPLWIDQFSYPRSEQNRSQIVGWESHWYSRFGRPLVGLTAVMLVFSAWKAIRLSFERPADPLERLVFTQTTPEIRQLRQRWTERAKDLNKSPRVTMYGDATWPMAWYVHDFSGHDFIKPANPSAAEAFDAVFLDTSETDFARDQLTDFDVYKIPLRHWWVPQPNPRFSEILEYFLTSRPYPRELRSAPQDLGVGHTSVLYLENRGRGRFFELSAPVAGAELIAAAGRTRTSGQVPTQDAKSH